MRALVKIDVRLGVLSAGLSRTKAVDVAWLAADPLLFDHMVRARGWSVMAFEAWLRSWLTGQLLQ